MERLRDAFSGSCRCCRRNPRRCPLRGGPRHRRSRRLPHIAACPWSRSRRARAAPSRLRTPRSRPRCHRGNRCGAMRKDRCRSDRAGWRAPLDRARRAASGAQPLRSRPSRHRSSNRTASGATEAAEWKGSRLRPEAGEGVASGSARQVLHGAQDINKLRTSINRFHKGTCRSCQNRDLQGFCGLWLVAAALRCRWREAQRATILIELSCRCIPGRGLAP